MTDMRNNKKLRDEIESLRQQLSAMTAERDKAKAMPMKYRRMEFNAQLQNENESLRQQLADNQKCEVMLRMALERLVTERRAGLASLEGWDAAREALAATTDLKCVILCHAEPRAWNETITGRLATSDDHHRSRFPMCYEPLYRAWEPK